jgi:hypothetical protein
MTSTLKRRVDRLDPPPDPSGDVAMMDGLELLRRVREIAAREGITVDELLAKHKASAEAPSRD